MITLYHGTNEADAHSIINNIRYRIFRRFGLDFGPGFYTTKKLRQAQEWANNRSEPSGKKSCVVSFETTLLDLSKLDNLSFTNACPDAHDYWDFVTQMKEGRQTTHYNNSFFSTVSGQLARSTGGRRYIRCSDQFSFHGQKGIDFLNSLTKNLIFPEYGNSF